jgi:hypothetical protein
MALTTVLDAATLYWHPLHEFVHIALEVLTMADVAQGYDLGAMIRR